MRLRVAVCFLFCIFLLESSASSQQLTSIPSSPPTRDSQAIAVLQNSLSSQGGQSAIASVSSAVVFGTLTPTDASSSPVGAFKWESDFTGQTYEFRNEMQFGSLTKIFVTNHGNPAFYNGTKSRNLPSHVAYAAVPFHLPALVLFRELNNLRCSIQLVGATQLNGNPAIHIRTQIKGDPIETELSVHDWYLDSTGLPVRVEYLTPGSVDMREHKSASADFSNFKTINGVSVPFKIVASEDGTTISTISISAVNFNANIPPTDLTQTVGVHSESLPRTSASCTSRVVWYGLVRANQPES